MNVSTFIIADMNFSADTTSEVRRGDPVSRVARLATRSTRGTAHRLDSFGVRRAALVKVFGAVRVDYIGKPWDNDKLLATRRKSAGTCGNQP